MKKLSVAYAALMIAIGAYLAATPAEAANEVYTSALRCNNKADASSEFKKDRYVYFDTDSSRVRDGDRDKIKHIYGIAKGRSAQQICLFGKASKIGGTSGNADLGRKRAEKVAQEFEALGWPRSRIVIGTEGEAWGWMEDMLTSDAEADRRVLIRLSM
ncbi:MAG: OmpA family protein [Parvibaculum sp.]|nr:OmpA family protein [Parvibaculum sp.]